MAGRVSFAGALQNEHWKSGHPSCPECPVCLLCLLFPVGQRQSARASGRHELFAFSVLQLLGATTRVFDSEGSLMT